MKKFFRSELFFKWVQCFAHLATIIGIFFAGFQLHNVAIQIKNTQNNTSANLVLKFDEQFNNKTNSGIISSLDNNEHLLKENGGKFTIEDIDNFLSIYETIANMYQFELINSNMICSNFSIPLIQAYKNQEIIKYIKSIRVEEEEPSIYGGFEDLAKEMIQYEGKDCP